jgi:mannosyltransferase OCH1-like enzyme
MKFISFYTEDYIEHANLLKKSLEDNNIDSSNIEYRESIGSWEANTQIKAEFILEKLRENDAVVWTDADSYLLQKPSFFDSITTDVGLFFLPIELSDGFVPPEYSILKNVDRYLQSGTMYFKNNPRVIKLLEDWIEINKKDNRQWDQWTLQVALQNNSNVTITQLPPEYISAPFITKVYPEHSPVIVHNQASLVTKEAFKSKIKTYKDLKGRVWNEPGIPKWIFRFGNDPLEQLNSDVYKMYQRQLENNPEYELFYFSEEDKLQFLKDVNDPRVEKAYNKVIPPAYKSDFLKFVLLYHYGGVYMDFTMEPLIKLKDIFKGYKRILVKDAPAPDGLCVGFITSEKGDELIRLAMEECIYNITYELYRENMLDITGPYMFGRIYKNIKKVNTIPVGKVSNDLYFYNMADGLHIYDGGVDDVPVVKLRMDNHHKLLYNCLHYEDIPTNLHYGNLYYKRKVFNV